jgi:NAD(P)-dependent dehydrogenase (short-subunit alcohol dehydrogenase family)
LATLFWIGRHFLAPKLIFIRGIIDTDMHRESVRIRGQEGDYKIQIPRKGRAEEVAALIVWLMCDGSQYITGTVQIIDGGIMA